MAVSATKAAVLAELLQWCITRRARSTGKILHGQVLTGGFSSDTFLQNRLVEHYSRSGSIEAAAAVFSSISSKNVYSWNSAVAAFSKNGNISLACDLLEAMPERNAVSWNTVIGALIRAGEPEKGLDLCLTMINEGFVPTRFTLTSALSACGSLPDLGLGSAWHGLAVKIGIDRDPFVENSLVAMYCKCGGARLAVRLFDEMRDRNEVTFTAMMGGLVKDGSMEEALIMFSKMRKKGVHVDSIAVSSVLGACKNNYFFGKQVHAQAVKARFDADIHVENSLLDFYAKSCDMESSQKAFDYQNEHNNVSWNILIAGYGNLGDCGKAGEVLKRMEALGFEPDDVTRVSQLSACAKSGDMDLARRAFERMRDPSLTSWNTILSGYAQKEMHQETIELFRQMQFSGIPFDRTTFAVVLSACSAAGALCFGKQIHASSTRNLIDQDLFVSSGLVDMYSKCGAIDSAFKIFDRMPERDVVSWNSMIAGFSIQSCSRKAFNLFREMLVSGLRPTNQSYPSIISSCARLSSLFQGAQLHAQTIKDGLFGDIFVASSLIDMYAKSGAVSDARKLFDQMPFRNIVAWNEMIHGYAQNGHGLQAVELFEQMLLQRDVQPDKVTLIAVLTGCSHSGMVDKAKEFFNAMEIDFGLIPMADHYACMMDALGRAARFSEIKSLIEKIPNECHDPIIWEVLLSACRLHGEIELGKFAAEKLFDLDPLSPTAYILLSNIYAAHGRWDLVSEVRRSMVDHGIVKNRAYSWFDDDDSIRAFMVDDDVRVVKGRG